MIRHAKSGFTLLEVLIALAVIALALVALVRTAGVGADALAHERETTLASYVAANVLADVRLREIFPPTGKREGYQRQGARDWRWELVVQGTSEPALRRLDVRVFHSGEASDPVFTLVGFAGQR
jgi:general secretion pathway protein I